jgi:hypothetical protein
MPQPTGPQDEAGAGPVLPPLAVPNRLSAFTTWSLPQIGQVMVSLANTERNNFSKSWTMVHALFDLRQSDQSRQASTILRKGQEKRL